MQTLCRHSHEKSIPAAHFHPTLSHSNTITGKVISVADGNTITILNGSQQTKIRFYGIDTPEKAQAFGKQAKKFIFSLTAAKTDFSRIV